MLDAAETSSAMARLSGAAKLAFALAPCVPAAVAVDWRERRRKNDRDDGPRRAHGRRAHCVSANGPVPRCCSRHCLAASWVSTAYRRAPSSTVGRSSASGHATTRRRIGTAASTPLTPTSPTSRSWSALGCTTTTTSCRCRAHSARRSRAALGPPCPALPSHSRTSLSLSEALCGRLRVAACQLELAQAQGDDTLPEAARQGHERQRDLPRLHDRRALRAGDGRAPPPRRRGRRAEGAAGCPVHHRPRHAAHHDRGDGARPRRRAEPAARAAHGPRLRVVRGRGARRLLRLPLAG